MTHSLAASGHINAEGIWDQISVWNGKRMLVACVDTNTVGAKDHFGMNSDLLSAYIPLFRPIEPCNADNTG